jgi:ribosomal protein S18 acetylase RimI-like enzyme
MKIEPLTMMHDRTTFRCGIPSFDKYLRAQAGRDSAKSLAAIFVAELSGEKVVGYYALSSAVILLPDLLGNSHRLVSRYPVLTAARLTRLAVDKRHRGQGYARALLQDVMERLQASPQQPMAVIAEVQNEAARHFLEHAGFQSFTDQPNRAFRALH